MTNTARTMDETGRIRMPYDKEALPLLRSFPGARWNPGEKCWTVSVSDADLPRTLEIANKLYLDVSESLRSRFRPTAQAISAEGIGLYPYQVAGVDHLSRRSKALLADEMGLGKTVQVASALRGSDAPVVVICPNSLKYNWRGELAKWTPEHQVTILSGRGSFRYPERGEAVILNYDILPAELPGTAPEGLTVVLDEAQYVKGRASKTLRSKRANALCEVAERVWALTGTPMMNRPFDLFGILANTGMAREVFGSFKKFLDLFGASKDRWGGYSFGIPGPEVAERLRRVMLRRLRADVLPDLPGKQIQTIVTNDLPAHLRADMDRAYAEAEGDLGRGILPPFERMAGIRRELAEARIPAMIELVEGCEEEEQAVVVFSAHRAPIVELAKRDGWETITGDVPPEERQRIVERCQSGELKGVGLTVAAGGTGLTLTRAHSMIFVDLDWVPANNSQAEDRCVRIGQEASSVLIRRLVSDHPLDLHVQDLLAEKIAMADASVDAETAIGSREEVEARAEAKAQTEEVQRTSARTLPEDVRAGIHRGLQILAGVCDGAVRQDGVGFSGRDSAFGRSLAERRDLTDKQTFAAARMIRKYHRQLPVEIIELAKETAEKAVSA